ncbi:MAG: hypothetical protein HY667_03305 [Chloroflexi bacterium]|nr:hypothetical protein [Chloroflexota bacterium]
MCTEIERQGIGQSFIKEAPNELDAVARGVEAVLYLTTGFSEMVTGQTMAIARQMHIKDEEIKKWAATRREYWMSVADFQSFLMRHNVPV